MLDTVIHHDCLTVLRGLADNSVDAIVSDPPAGISFMGKDWDNPDTFPTRDRKNGQGSTFGKSMTNGPEWSYNKRARDGFIAFMREVMTEALRVLKPGGHALIWALPRTSHWTATALEDAGFEVRDKLYHLFGSGFPKSLDISKAIDKMQGAEREVVGLKMRPDGKTQLSTVPNGYTHPDSPGWDRPWMHDMEAVKRQASITAPATPEAAQYAGYGTALKPSCEEWILCRKPLAESSIAAQVLATGTGGLAIDACRVGNDTIKVEGWRKVDSPVYGQTHKVSDYHGGTHQGRYPSTLLLSHSLWCVPRGTKRVRGNGGVRPDRPIIHNGTSALFGNGTSGIEFQAYNDSEGYEQVEAYDCAPDCPIAELDRQSGVRSASWRKNKHGGWQSEYVGGQIETHVSTPSYKDEGTASRYFTNFPPDDYTPFLYQSKASRAERNRGCEDLPLGEVGDVGQLVSRIKSGWINDPRSPNGGYEMSPSKPAQNNHPTVKPLALMRWLIRLITPPDGIVLDPFCGSGSTCVAAIAEGKHFIGIEQDESYVNIANARIEYARTHEPDVVQVATKKVPNGRWGKNKPIVHGGADPQSMPIAFGYDKQGVVTQGHADQDGMETVEDWDCAPDCPVRILGEQSGERKSGGRTKHIGEVTKNNHIYHAHTVASEFEMEASTGTAARYFQQFAPDLWTQDMQDAEDVFIAEGGYEGEVGA